jgi:hypothetical protein
VTKKNQRYKPAGNRPDAEKNSVIKGPLIESIEGKIVALGFDEKRYADLFVLENGNE